MNDACNTTGSATIGKTEVKAEMNTVVSLTERAAEKIKEFMLKEGKMGSGLRVAVLPGGCSGHTYSLTFEERSLSSDTQLEFFGVKVFVDKMSEPLLQGSQIDYVESLQGAGFSVNNPNVNGGCGCGKSF
jgi:iron-sulfur cluster assembly accessory protein